MNVLAILMTRLVDNDDCIKYRFNTGIALYKQSGVAQIQRHIFAHYPWMWKQKMFKAINHSSLNQFYNIKYAKYKGYCQCLVCLAYLLISSELVVCEVNYVYVQQIS